MLAETRELLLRKAGIPKVMSALYQQEARFLCREDADLLILGHSVLEMKSAGLLIVSGSTAVHQFCPYYALGKTSFLRLRSGWNRASRKKSSALCGKYLASRMIASEPP